MKPIAEIDDLITIKGYGEQIFRIDSYTHETLTDRDGESEDIIYDCHCVITAEFALADQEDIVVIRKAADADGFLRTYQMPRDVKPTSFIYGMDFGILPTEVFGMQKKMMTKATPKQKEPTRQERIDALLDERLTVGIADDFVKVADPEAYKQRRYDEIDAQIRELTAD